MKVIKCNVVKVVGNQIINLAKGPHVLIGLQMAIPFEEGSCEIFAVVGVLTNNHSID